VDEQFGAPTDVPTQARGRGLKLAMPVEKSGQNEFDFEYGDAFGDHIEKFDPDFSKVLVRYNPDDPDTEMNERQLGRLKRLADWLHEHDRLFLFELLVPATDDQLASVDGDSDRYDADLRPELMRRAIEDIQNYGIEVDIWKIEGVDERSDAEMLAQQTRAGGRDGVVCVLLGRGASDEKVDHWLREAAPVDGFVGFAIGRSIWGDALKGFIDGSLEREDAARQIGENYLRFVRVYEEAEATAAAR
jgi:5-dehydro-2-deoxygluconokinase